MNLRNQISVVIYRIRERGLEVFLLSRNEQNVLQIPQGRLDDSQHQSLFQEDNIIELDKVESDANIPDYACAIEGDWHDIPSLKGMLKNDIFEAKEKIEEVLPELEKGTFVAVKDALKKVMPEQYAFLKELKEIITDRNSVNGI